LCRSFGGLATLARCGGHIGELLANCILAGWDFLTTEHAESTEKIANWPLVINHFKFAMAIG
jgi:hypothetical protein